MAKQQHETTRESLRYYIKRPGELIHYADAAKDMNLTKEVVNAALARTVARHPEMGLHREGAAGYYVYRTPLAVTVETPPEPLPEPPRATWQLPEVWEELGEFNGRIMVRNTEGKIKVLSDE